MIKIVLALAALMMTATVNAADKVNLKDTATKLVPGSKVIKEDGNEFDLQTPKGTVVEVELNRDGTIDEASGDAVNGGDIFAPGSNMLTLEAAITALKKAGKTPAGDWQYEKSMLHGWVYEFEGVENGKDMEYAISAKDGKLVKDNRDIL